jgi:sigma-B regulation protein RsbU (phosphoserine phosphatase)
MWALSVSPPSRKLPLEAKILEELLPIVGEVNAVLDPEALFPTIARLLRRIIDYRILDIFVGHADGTLTPAYYVGYDSELAGRMRLKPGEGIVGAAAESRETVFVEDVRKDARYLALAPGVVAELAIPLLHRDRLVGVLNIEGPDPKAFHHGARTALQVLAGHLAVAIENAQFHRETRWYAGLLATLYEIGKETASILDLDELLHRVADVVKRVIDYEMFGILLLDEERRELVLRKSVSYGSIQEKTRIKLGEGLTGIAAETKQPILVSDVRQDPRYLELIPETRSELVVPLVTKDRVVGVFDLESSQLDRFNEEHVKVLTALAGQVAVAIDNARLYQELVRREMRLNRELSIARDVQNGLFPEEDPSGPAFETSAHFRPARELGGDLYDFYDIGEQALGVAVGDVAGKGVPAALYAAFASGTVRARAFERHPPADLLYRANRTLRRRGIEGFFCTLAYALFDFQARRVQIANSGLPYPLHFQAQTGRCRPLEVAGLPLGAFGDATYENLSVELRSGDVFVFLSDGVSEAWNGEEEYGALRLQEQVERHATLSAPLLGDRLVADVDRFLAGRPLLDDLTLVVVKIRGDA